ncbi:hypothetical protein H6P81_017642 [Aristolochia fimbriata]|uniref:Small multi-drug export n=1 Tax=Aristolochia fimbriata TaxID=158543 RepID=A0AAV7DZ68_ARIFI|nr:hypothetical protein H6P81_017642 [Aristolochia fimbriata]
MPLNLNAPAFDKSMQKVIKQQPLINPYLPTLCFFGFSVPGVLSGLWDGGTTGLFPSFLANDLRKRLSVASLASPHSSIFSESTTGIESMMAANAASLTLSQYHHVCLNARFSTVAASPTRLPKSTVTRSSRFSPQRGPLAFAPFPSPVITQKRQFLRFSEGSPVKSISCVSSTRRFCSWSVTLPGDDDNAKVEPHFLKVLVRFAIWVLPFISVFAACRDAHAAEVSIRASSFGLKVATALRGFGWPDEAVVFALATLPVLELRGAVPVGYWMNLKPLKLTILSVMGNMVPVPFIILYLKKLAETLAGKNASASGLIDWLLSKVKEKAGPVEEFQWLGLMLFVAVPFPGTGAWTGAIIASILDMPFWSAMSANFVGVVLAGLLVNLLVNLGLKYAVVTGVGLFFISTVMWSLLRIIKKSFFSN